MAKTKNKHRMSDKVRSKKGVAQVKVNPFEVKINRQKHDVLGKKAKHDRGMPGIARSKANKKRKETLLVEYKQRGKCNKFIDRRFGETNPEMSLEDKMLQRFALEKQQTHEKSGLFSLNEEDSLTHYGQSLSEIEKFDEPNLSDEDDEDQGRLGADIVGTEHFGGFLTKKDVDEDDLKKTWKERMEEIIAKSKKKKFERQSEKDKTTALTEELDSQWKELMHVMAESKRNKTKDATTDQPVKKIDEYDMMVRELQFEIKGQGSERLKTDDELAKEEKEKLDNLEADRLRRMKGVSVEDEGMEKNVYRSADDLDDGFDLGPKEVRFEVAYDDGKLIGVQDDDEVKNYVKDDDEEKSEDEDDNEDEDEDEDDEDDEDDGMEDLSDLESSEEEGDETTEEEKSKIVTILKSKLKKLKVDSEQTAEDLKKKEVEMEKAKKELPYTFKAPETYEDLLNLLQDHSEKDQLLLIERLQKLYHPSLAEGNNDKLQKLYTLLVEYYCDLALQDPPLLVLLDALVKPLYQLTQKYPLHSATTWTDLIRVQQQEFTEHSTRKGGRGIYPGLDMLLSFQLIGRLYPTSDFKHPVVTPTMLFMAQILTQCPVHFPVDIASGLILSAIFLQYITFAKRYVPEVLNFLQGLLFTAIKKDPNKFEPVCPPFKPVGKNIDLLKLNKKCKKTKIAALKLTEVFSTGKQNVEFLENDDFKVVCMYQCMKLLAAYMEIYKELPAFTEMFKPIIYFLEKLSLKWYPEEIKVLHAEILTQYSSSESSSTRTPLVMPKQRPKPLKMFEPKFEDVFDGKKKRIGSRETQEKQRLVHKYKKEMKGAVRSLRQDSTFLAREKLNEQIERDAERKRKVNQLFADLAAQEGDYKAMKRAKDN